MAQSTTLGTRIGNPWERKNSQESHPARWDQISHRPRIKLYYLRNLMPHEPVFVQGQILLRGWTRIQANAELSLSLSLWSFIFSLQRGKMPWNRYSRSIGGRKRDARHMARLYQRSCSRLFSEITTVGLLDVLYNLFQKLYTKFINNHIIEQRNSKEDKYIHLKKLSRAS